MIPSPHDPVALAQALVRINSVNPSLDPEGPGEGAVARLAARWLKGWGFQVEVEEVLPGRPNVVARRPGVGRRLLLNGHLDTVGVEDMEGNPFSGAIREGILHGRGACDMKGGMAALLSAAARLVASGVRGDLTVALTADEEHASLGMQALLAQGLQWDGAVVCEPTSLTVMPASKGFVWAEVSFRGRAAHGSRPEMGRDAIRDAAAFLVALDEVESELESRPAHPLLGRASLHAGTIRGGTAPSVYPHRCTVVVERRTLPGEGTHQVLEELERMVDTARERRPELDARVSLIMGRPASEVPETHPLVRGLQAALEGVGRSPEPRGMTAFVDAALLHEAGTPAVCFGPGSIALAHGPLESVGVEEIEIAARVLEDFGRTFLEG